MEPTQPNHTTDGQDHATPAERNALSVLEQDRLIDLTAFDKPESPVLAAASTPVHPLISLLIVGTIALLVVTSERMLWNSAVVPPAGSLMKRPFS